MQFIKDNTAGIYLITGLETHAVRVDEQVHRCSLVISAEHLISSWPPSQVSDISASHWDAVLELRPELILLGTGSQLIFPEPEQLAPIHRAGIGIEVMDTHAASRTYNLLVHEGRKVAAGLIISQDSSE